MEDAVGGSKAQINGLYSFGLFTTSMLCNVRKERILNESSYCLFGRDKIPL